MRIPMWPEIKRKLFHLLSILYVIGLILVPRAMFLWILGGWFLTVAAVEMIRLKSPRMHAWFQSHWGGLLREEESRRFSGVFWMALGVLCTVSLVESVPLASTALLYLIFGDAAASLIGKRVRGPVWPGSMKTISGSVACFVVCLAVGAWMLNPMFGWSGVFVGAAVATAVEKGVLPLDDNFSIPVFSAVALHLTYRFMFMVGH